MSLTIPEHVLDRCGIIPANVPLLDDPWLPLAWPVQAEPWALSANPDASDLAWARAILRLRLTHPETPWLAPKGDPLAAPPLCRLFAWGLNRVVQATLLDTAMTRAGWDAVADRAETLAWWQAHAADTPEVIRLLAALELVYRGASGAEQAGLSECLGEDVMRAAYQLNMMCIDPANADRTLLQVQRIAIKVMPTEAAQCREHFQICLSDRRELELL